MKKTTEEQITPEQLVSDGWVKNEDGWEKPLKNTNPLNQSEDTDIKLIVHRMFNEPSLAVLLPDGGMLNFKASNFKKLQQFESMITFYDASF